MKKMESLNLTKFTNSNVVIVLLILIIGTYACKKSISEETVAMNTKGQNVTNTLNNTDTTIKGLANFDVGVEELYDVYTNDTQTKNLILREYDRITTETMKMDYYGATLNDVGNNTLNHTDLLNDLNFAQANGLKVHGHTLIYWPSSESWFRNIQTKDSLEQYAKKFIQSVVRKSEGKVASIDVANELFNIREEGFSNDQNNNIVGTWYQLYGNDKLAFTHFIGKCFKWAREADEEVNGANIKLFYNDFNHENYPAKRDAIFNFCVELRNLGYPIDGIGMQFHLTLLPTVFSSGPTAIASTFQGITDAIVKASQLRDANGNSFLIHISELDVAIDEAKQTSANAIFGSNEQWKQYDIIRHVVSQYRTIVPENQKWCLTLWNTSDKNSWYRKYKDDYDYPTLFDTVLNKKFAYYGFLSGASQTGFYYLPEATFHLYNMQTGKYAEVLNGSNDNAALIQQNGYNSSLTNNSQLFKIVNNKNGFYHILNVKSGRSLDHYSSTPFSLQLYDYGANDNQQFSILGLSTGIVDGRFNIISKANGYFLEVRDQSVDVGAKLQMGIANYTNVNQNWKLVY